MKAILGHLRHNLVAYAALLIALVAAPTSAYAVATIRSADIVDGQVMSVDLADNGVQGRDIRNGGVVHKDLAPNAVTGDKVANDSLDGTDLAFDSVTGYDVNESTLTRVPSALQGGLGRYGFSGSCDPETNAYVTCSNVQITLDKPGRLLAIGTVRAEHELDSNRFLGGCRINTDRGAVQASADQIDGEGGETTVDWGWDERESLTVMAVTDVFPAGTHNLWVECYQNMAYGAITFPQARIVAVALGDG